LALQTINEQAMGADAKTMKLQYLDALKALGVSPSSKIVVPMELSSLVSGFTAAAEAASTNASTDPGA
jgi:hypothetical protein